MDALTSAPLCILFDNGSLCPESMLNLRVIALRLQAMIGVNVRPVSLLHSSSPGRHASPGGDIAEICTAAEQAQPGLKTHLTDLMGGDPRLVEVLADRCHEARVSVPV